MHIGQGGSRSRRGTPQKGLRIEAHAHLTKETRKKGRPEPHVRNQAPDHRETRWELKLPESMGRKGTQLTGHKVTVSRPVPQSAGAHS